MNIKAAVLHHPNQPMSIETVALAPPKAGEVLVRIAASGLCHTDWSVISGDRPHPLPVVLGHEGAGVVEEVGVGVSSVRKGDHVICSWAPSCGHCFFCDHDLAVWCEEWVRSAPNGVLFDGSSRITVGDSAAYHFTTVSSHAEFCVIQEASAIPVSKDIPLDLACLIGCGVMTGFGAVVRHAKVRPGESVAVFGCGAVGLNVVQSARLAGASIIVAVDIHDHKLDWAKNFGATHGYSANDETVERIKALTEGRGVDHAFEAVGSPQPLVQAIESARAGGDVVLLGAGGADSTVTLPYNIFRGDKRITRLTYGQGKPRIDFPRIVDLYLSGRLMLDELITSRISMSQINKGFAQMFAGQTIRSVIVMK
jgi:S-(hydroxymethyl)glutathione dehydrogenase/alcohol dehydrogenase